MSLRLPLCIAAVALVACSKPQGGNDRDTMTQRQKDSVFGQSAVPGADAVTKAQPPPIRSKPLAGEPTPRWRSRIRRPDRLGGTAAPTRHSRSERRRARRTTGTLKPSAVSAANRSGAGLRESPGTGARAASMAARAAESATARARSAAHTES